MDYRETLRKKWPAVRRCLKIATSAAGIAAAVGCSEARPSIAVTPSTEPAPNTAPTRTPLPTLTAEATATIRLPEIVTATVALTAAATEANVPQGRYIIADRCVSSMNQTKDRVRNPRNKEFVEKWIGLMEQAGANCVSIETPYDSPSNGDSVSYTKLWIDVAREHNFKIWHRHTFLSFEGIYDAPVNNQKDYAAMLKQYIIDHPDFFKAGDILTPLAENAIHGVEGANGCPQNLCQYSSAEEYNQKTQELIKAAHAGLQEIGMDGKVDIDGFSWDGYFLWGNNNPDHLYHSFVDQNTLTMLGNRVSIDHYPPEGQTMEQGLMELAKTLPGVEVSIGEWGDINGWGKDFFNQTLETFKKYKITRINYFQGGPSGKESLLNENMTPNNNYLWLQAFYMENR